MFVFALVNSRRPPSRRRYQHGEHVALADQLSDSVSRLIRLRIIGPLQPAGSIAPFKFPTAERLIRPRSLPFLSFSSWSAISIPPSHVQGRTQSPACQRRPAGGTPGGRRRPAPAAPQARSTDDAPHLRRVRSASDDSARSTGSPLGVGSEPSSVAERSSASPHHPRRGEGGRSSGGGTRGALRFRRARQCHGSHHSDPDPRADGGGDVIRREDPRATRPRGSRIHADGTTPRVRSRRPDRRLRRERVRQIAAMHECCGKHVAPARSPSRSFRTS